MMGPDELYQGVQTLASLIRENLSDAPVAIVGIRSRGDEVAERLCHELASEEDREVDFGVLDISLYRDDYGHLTSNPKLEGSDLSFDVEGAHIILVDDVLFTGRTIRAALDALADYGRPGKVELAVLIDRGHRELPIQPDYVGIKLETERKDHVLVKLENTDGEDSVEIVKAS